MTDVPRQPDPSPADPWPVPGSAVSGSASPGRVPEAGTGAETAREMWPTAARPSGTPDPGARRVSTQLPSYVTGPAPGYRTDSRLSDLPSGRRIVPPSGYVTGSSSRHAADAAAGQNSGSQFEQGTKPPPCYGAGSPSDFAAGPSGYGLGTPSATGTASPYGNAPASRSGYAPGLSAGQPPAGQATSPLASARLAGPPPRHRRPGRLVAMSLVIVLGLIGIAAGGLALSRELGRGPTPAEISAALRQEIATRWQRLSAGKIFPATITYTDAEYVRTSARLVGIARPVSCQAAFETTAQGKLAGCRMVLRATYLDASGTLVATAGVALMASSQSASALARLQAADPHGGLQPLAFDGTIANHFGNHQRAAASAQAAGPYLFAFAVGYADGKPGKVVRGNPDLDLLGSGILTKLIGVLTSHGSPCKMKDISC